jgi:hypothetical protein
MDSIQGRTDIAAAERLLMQTQVDEATGCLIPTKAPYDGSGSAQIRIGGKLYTMRRVAFVLAGGVLGPGQVVGRTCDRPECIAPQHLKAMTRSEAAKAGFARGTNHNKTYRKLRPARVAELLAYIRDTGCTLQAAADRFGIHYSSVKSILRRRGISRRRHRPGPKP